jgi:predicted transcriptional regulator
MIGWTLKSEMIKCGLKVWELSKVSGIPYYRVSGIFSGRIDPTPNEVAKIRRAIDSLSRDAGNKESVNNTSVHTRGN